jgi:hypothetical protein
MPELPSDMQITPRRPARTSSGLVDEPGRYRAAALFGVVGDVVPGDVRVAGVADVVDLQAGAEVGEAGEPVVGRQAVQALLLVLVVRPGPAALGAKARRVVPARRAGRGKMAITIGSDSSEMSTVAT